MTSWSGLSSMELLVPVVQATGWTAEGIGVLFPAGARYFLYSTASRPSLGPTQPPIQSVSRAVPPGVKRSRREAYHSPSNIAKVKNTWISTSTPQYFFMAYCLISCYLMLSFFLCFSERVSNSQRTVVCRYKQHRSVDHALQTYICLGNVFIYMPLVSGFCIPFILLSIQFSSFKITENVS
jgi:hypothetical protein